MFLSRTKLCVFNFSYRCRNGRDCNFAHSLKQLLMPEESQGNWSEAFRNGNVDINFWPTYTPNRESIARFHVQFMWEYRNQAEKIPNWAWGHAQKLQIIKLFQVPQGIPKDFDWPDMQRQWHEQKQHGRPTAYNTCSASVAVLRQRQESLRQAWLDSPQQGKGTVKGKKGQGKGKGMGQGKKGKGNGKGQGKKGKGKAASVTLQPWSITRPNLDPADPTLPPNAEGKGKAASVTLQPWSITRPNLDPADPTLPPNADMPPAPKKMQHKPNKMPISGRPETTEEPMPMEEPRVVKTTASCWLDPKEEPKEEPEEVPCQGLPESQPPPAPPMPPEGLPEPQPESGRPDPKDVSSAC